MVIDTFTVRSFKSLVDQTISLGRANFFIGANGSGKSNILEAFGILSAAASGRVDDAALFRRGVRPGIPRLYKSAFSNRISPHIFFEAKSGDVRYGVSLNNPLDKPRPAWLYKTEDLTDGLKHIVGRSPVSARNDEQGLAALKVVELDQSDPAAELITVLRDYAIFAPTTLALRGLVSSPQLHEPVGISGEKLADAVAGILQLEKEDEPKQYFLREMRSLIDWADSFDVSDRSNSLLSTSIPRQKSVIRFHDRYMRSGKNTLTAYDASEGALYILFSSVLAIHPSSPPCLAIDNLDQTLNPRLIQRLTALLCKLLTEDSEARQMLFTVHNPAVLDGLPLQNDKVRLFSVDRNSEGFSIVQRIHLTPEVQQLSEEKGWPLSRLWMMGHLGGMPNV